MYKCVRRFLTYISLPWPEAQQPYLGIQQLSYLSIESQAYNTTYISTVELWCNVCTAKTQYRKFETIIPRNGIGGLSPKFNIHLSVSNLYTVLPQTVSQFCFRKICGPIPWIYISLTAKWLWKLGLRGRAISFLGLHKWDFRCSVWLRGAKHYLYFYLLQITKKHSD